MSILHAAGRKRMRTWRSGDLLFRWEECTESTVDPMATHRLTLCRGSEEIGYLRFVFFTAQDYDRRFPTVLEYLARDRELGPQAPEFIPGLGPSQTRRLRLL